MIGSLVSVLTKQSNALTDHHTQLKLLHDIVAIQAARIIILETVVTRLKTQNEERARHINLASLN